jgi:hypothetical protein
VDELYVLGRRVLLDALAAHRGAVALVGAQIIYWRVGEADLAERFGRLLQDDRSSDVAEGGIALLREQSADRRAVGVEMILRAVGLLADPEEMAASTEDLATDLLQALGR